MLIKTLVERIVQTFIYILPIAMCTFICQAQVFAIMSSIVLRPAGRN